MIKVRKDRLPDLGLPDENGLYAIPVEDGDTISFICEIAPDQSQRVVTTNETIPSKVYKIFIIIGDETNKTCGHVVCGYVGMWVCGMWYGYWIATSVNKFNKIHFYSKSRTEDFQKPEAENTD